MPSEISLTANDGHIKCRPGEKQPWLDLDAELARHFGDEPHEVEWYFSWYDTIGINLALGKTLPDIAGIFANRLQDAESRDLADPATSIYFRRRLLQIAEYLRDNYNSDAWYQPR